MAVIYVYSGAVGLGTGASWTDAFTTLGAAITAWTTSDVIWLADDSAEALTATTTYTNASSTKSNPCPIYSVNRTTNVYSPASAAQVDGSGAGWTFSFQLHYVMHGCYIKGANNCRICHGSSASVRAYHTTFESVVASGSHYMDFSAVSGTDTDCDFYACTFKFTGTGGSCYFACLSTIHLWFRDCIFSTTNPHSTYFWYFSETGRVDMVGCDVSGATGATYFTGGTGYNNAEVQFANCNMGSSWSSDPARDDFIEVINSDFADQYDIYSDFGNYAITTTATYRDTSDNGVENKISYKNSVTTEADYGLATYCPPIFVYASATGSKTVTIELAHTYTSSVTERDVFVDAGYLSSGSSMKMAVAASAMASATYTYDPIATPANLTASSETWTGAAGATTQKIEVPVTINRIGYVVLYVRIRKYESGKFCYVCPTASIA